jgi:hypothetical protein
MDREIPNQDSRSWPRSAAFYGDVPGWESAFPTFLGSPAAAFSSVPNHHALLLIEVGDSDEELRQAYDWLAAAGVTFVETSDLTITHSAHSAHILDPTAVGSISTSTNRTSTGGRMRAQ